VSRRDECWVTGIGAVSAAGIGVPALRSLLVEGRGAVAPLPAASRWTAGACPTPPPSRMTRRLERSGKLFATAAEEAWQQAGLGRAPPTPSRCTLLEGSSLGPLAEMAAAARSGSGRAWVGHPSHLVRFMPGAGGAAFAHEHGIEGDVLHLSAGSVSAAVAIIEAVERLRSDRADIVVAGGAECPLEETVLATFAAAGVLADPGEPGGCRPFDAARSGTVLGEGAGALILERERHARRRGATPLAIIWGTGSCCESYGIVGPDPQGRGVATAARAALRRLSPSSLGWIKAHGTGTRVNDAAECLGLLTLLGSDLVEIPLTSLKPALGHALGACAAVESVAAIVALRERVVPAMLNTRRLDPTLPACTLALEPMTPRAPTVLLLAESFGGRCAAWTIRAA
jgi:3-oxoacyl-(acyl-carrier-protein) synthase